MLLPKLAYSRTAYGISTHSLNLLKSYLTNRRQWVRVEDVTSDISYVNSGIPQGSVLGPLLFNIFINDIFYFIKEAKLLNYADDNQLYFADTDPAVVDHVVNKELGVVCEWFCNNKITLNPEKCKYKCKHHIIHSPRGFSGIIYNTGWGTLPDCLRCSLQVMKE